MRVNNDGIIKYSIVKQQSIVMGSYGDGLSNGHIEIQLLQGCSSLLQVNDSHKGGKLIMLLHVTSLNLANLPPAPCMWRVGSDPQHPGIPPYVP